ncbi:MAG: DUF2635 domain-containing protein [Pseudomonadota bacterium]
MTRVLVKPLKDHAIPKPNGKALAPEGEIVELGGFWRRRERDGDVEILPAPQPKAEKSAKKPVDKPASKEA